MISFYSVYRVFSIYFPGYFKIRGVGNYSSFESLMCNKAFGRGNYCFNALMTWGINREWRLFECRELIEEILSAQLPYKPNSGVTL